MQLGKSLENTVASVYQIPEKSDVWKSISWENSGTNKRYLKLTSVFSLREAGNGLFNGKRKLNPYLSHVIHPRLLEPFDHGSFVLKAKNYKRKQREGKRGEERRREEKRRGEERRGEERKEERRGD